MDYGSIVPLNRPGTPTIALFTPRPVEYMRLWKSQDSEPILFPYSEISLDLVKAKGEAETVGGIPPVRGIPPYGEHGHDPGVDPYAETHVAPPAAGGETTEEINPAHPKPPHLQTDEHRLAHVKGVLWGASHRMADMERRMTAGGSGIAVEEAQDYSKLNGLKDRMTKVSEALESAGVKDLPQHHTELQQHWQANPGARSGAVGGKLHLDSSTMDAVHGHLAGAQAGPAPVQQQSAFKPIPRTGGPRGRVEPAGPHPEPTTGRGTSLSVGPQQPTTVSPPTPVAMPSQQPALTPMPALGGGASRAELEMAPATGAPGTKGDIPKQLQRSLQLMNLLIKAAAVGRTSDPMWQPHTSPGGVSEHGPDVGSGVMRKITQAASYLSARKQGKKTVPMTSAQIKYQGGEKKPVVVAGVHEGSTVKLPEGKPKYTAGEAKLLEAGKVDPEKLKSLQLLRSMMY